MMTLNLRDIQPHKIFWRQEMEKRIRMLKEIT
jgi:hypothetical protein